MVSRFTLYFEKLPAEIEIMNKVKSDLREKLKKKRRNANIKNNTM